MKTANFKSIEPYNWGSNVYIVSNHWFAIADIASAAWTPLAEKVGWDLADWPNVKTWFDRCLARPTFTRVVEVAGTIPDEIRIQNFRRATVGVGS